jgi:hypothetical protein
MSDEKKKEARGRGVMAGMSRKKKKKLKQKPKRWFHNDPIVYRSRGQ